MKILKTPTIVLMLALAVSFYYGCRENPKILVEPESFDVFYQQFMNDSAFQLSRIQFPLHGRLTRGETPGLDVNGKEVSDSMIWVPGNWQILHSTEGINMAPYKVKKIITDTFVTIRTTEKGFSLLFEETYRKSDDSQWYLVKLVDIDR